MTTTSTPHPERNLFFKRWLKNPLAVGAVLPSSKTLARRISESVMEAHGEDIRRGAFVVEVGAGTGSFTQALLDAGLPPAQLVAVERDPELFDYLAARFPQLKLICGDAEELTNLLPPEASANCTAVVSGIPMVTLSREIQRSLVDAILRILKTGHPFYQFTYCPFSSLPAKALGLAKKRLFTTFRNFPPASVWSYREA
jgi:phosphatidylethanolamine/phosphatidyl-N-methylethanolamine N-methyltransferase